MQANHFPNFFPSGNELLKGSGTASKVDSLRSIAAYFRRPVGAKNSELKIDSLEANSPEESVAGSDTDNETDYELNKENCFEETKAADECKPNKEENSITDEHDVQSNTSSSPASIFEAEANHYNDSENIRSRNSPYEKSPKSCSDDSIKPVTGKKRKNLFEDTDSDTETEQKYQDNETIREQEINFKRHFKCNREREARSASVYENNEETMDFHTSHGKEITNSFSTSTLRSAAATSSRNFVSDFDQMLQRKRKEKSINRASARNLDFIAKNDDLIEELINQMEDAAHEDRCLKEQGLPATKKLAILKLAMSQLIKKDLQPLFLEHNILSTLAEWLTPLTRHLPPLPIREGILQLLEDFPTINSSLLKESGIGKALMFLCKHPDETKKNRECCRRLIALWARPIYNLTCDYSAMSKAERQQRDIEMSVRYQKEIAEKLSSSNTEVVRLHTAERKIQNPAEQPICDGIGGGICSEELQEVPIRPGQRGWVPRARVPQPSTKEYVHRPESLSNYLIPNRLKPRPNRYESLVKKVSNSKRANTQKSGINLTIFGGKK